MKAKPNLFIVGVAKAGTTSLHESLSQHPNIAMSKVKEPHFFSDNISKELSFDQHKTNIKSREEYLTLFTSDKDAHYFGEASPSYLWDMSVSKKIYDFNPNAKLIAILRNPIERAYSHFKMDIHSEREKESDFLKALEIDQSRKHRLWGRARLYVDLGFYSDAISNYQKYFGKQMLVLQYEQFKKNPEGIFNKIWSFLELPPIEQQNVQLNQSISYNKFGRKMKSLRIGKITPKPLKKVLKQLITPKTDVIPQDAYEYLLATYYDDIRKLSRLGYPFYDELTKN